jgi:hypothetical protein
VGTVCRLSTNLRAATTDGNVNRGVCRVSGRETAVAPQGGIRTGRMAGGVGEGMKGETEL